MPQPSRFARIAPPTTRVAVLLDGNSHSTPAPLCRHCPPGYAVVSEALLPEIRLYALLLAALRQTFRSPSPPRLSSAADWMAARLAVLNCRSIRISRFRQPEVDAALMQLHTLKPHLRVDVRYSADKELSPDILLCSLVNPLPLLVHPDGLIENSRRLRQSYLGSHTQAQVA